MSIRDRYQRRVHGQDEVKKRKITQKQNQASEEQTIKEEMNYNGSRRKGEYRVMQKKRGMGDQQENYKQKNREIKSQKIRSGRRNKQGKNKKSMQKQNQASDCLLYTSPSPRDQA
eukprot:TRINITY_DN4645_c0_g1_i2.p2 TRINITY_DN4645_c0_g1~~TRINITY_DN4645_c0_g1_i2.p2  ORF type:complete len:131 (-),score=20.62 TRINITY_DN4645_c0_g1_i2:38-382(-)